MKFSCITGIPRRSYQRYSLAKAQRKSEDLGREFIDKCKNLEISKYSFYNSNNDRIVCNGTTQIVKDMDDDDKRRRLGIPAETFCNDTLNNNIPDNVSVFKTNESKNLIRKAILSNEFLKNIVNESKLKLIVEVMHLRHLEQNEFIIREGEPGAHLFISCEGRFAVIKHGNIVKQFDEGVAFGELAILYHAKRLASVIALKPSKVWVLDRNVFQKIVRQTGVQEHENKIRFLRTVPILFDLHASILSRIADLLNKEFFTTGTVIVKEGDAGNKFYIISGGQVSVSKKYGGRRRSVATLMSGNYFGELALLKEDSRQATVTALPPGVECLTLARGAFKKYLGDIERLKNANYNIELFEPFQSPHTEIDLKDLRFVGLLGIGGFGRVDLVRFRKQPNQTFALKRLKKCEMVEQQQQTHVFNEKNLMLNCNNSFITRLYQTYKDNKYLYFLLEACLGGDVWTVLQKRGAFDEYVARFVIACVIEALHYLHTRNIIYRDLKPENLLLTKNGYVKLVDFGFAKQLDDSSKTWTFAGTPEYIAPEVILNNGHNKAVDYWSLGVLIFELMAGRPPFRGTDHMDTYNQILKGVDHIKFPLKFAVVPQVIIKQLCRADPNERLGCFKDGIADIRNHKWFLSFNWDQLRAGTFKSPLVRTINGPDDLSNFETFGTPADDREPPDDTSGWDADF